MTAALQAPGVALGAEGLIALRQVAMAARSDPPVAALPGGIATRRRGQGMEVADIRDYVPGDDLRALDRGSTARTGRLHVREFHAERDRVTLLVADFRASMFWGLRRALRSVAAAEVLALIGWDAVESGGRVGLLALTPEAPLVVPARGRARGMLDVIGGMVEAHGAALATLLQGRAELAPDRPLDRALSPVERLAPSGAEVVIASGFDSAGDGLADRLGALARRRHPRLLLVTAAEASDLPEGSYPIRTADGRRVRVRLARGDLGETLPMRDVAGWDALVVPSADPVETLARRLAAGFGLGRAAA